MDLPSSARVTTLARLASGCMATSVRFASNNDGVFTFGADAKLGVMARNCNGQHFNVLQNDGWFVGQFDWSLMGKDVKMVVDASAGRVAFHSAATGQTIVKDGLPKGPLWLTVGLNGISATVVAVGMPAVARPGDVD